MSWPILKDFGEQHSALAKLKDGDKPSTPKITKSLTIMKWTEAFTHHLHVQIGTRGIPLSYIIRDDENPGQRPALLPDRSYSAATGCVMEELIQFSSHNHPLFKMDNSKVWTQIEEATRGTTYMPPPSSPLKRRGMADWPTNHSSRSLLGLTNGWWNSRSTMVFWSRTCSYEGGVFQAQ